MNRPFEGFNVTDGTFVFKCIYENMFQIELLFMKFDSFRIYVPRVIKFG